MRIARLNEQLAYGFDPAGNLNYRTNNALVQSFVVNSNNELTSATNGGTLAHQLRVRGKRHAGRLLTEPL
jgi:hypothetical protein